MKADRRPPLAGLREALGPLTRGLSWIAPSVESDLRYTVLPPYEIPNLVVVTGLLVENRGDEAAHNVKIEIDFDGTAVSKIHHMQVVSDDRYILRGGGEEYAFATIRLQEMNAGSKVFVYMATADTVTPEIKLSSFERKRQAG